MATRSPDLSQIQEQFRLLVGEVEEYAIFMLDPEGHVTSWNDGAEKIKGYTEGEILGTHFSVFYPEEDRKGGKPQRALDVVAQTGEWVDEGWRIRKDGSRFWARVTITALRDEEGRLRGYGKVTRDMTERRQRELELERQKSRAEEAEERARRENALLRLMQAVAETANDADTLDDAMTEVLEEVCAHTGWAIGHAYRRTGDDTFTPTSAWHLADEDRFAPFCEATNTMVVSEGEGLPGRAAVSDTPVWSAGVQRDDTMLRSQVASELGIQWGCAVPIRLDGTTVSVLEFFSEEAEPYDEQLMQAMQSVGVQLARVAERQQARETLQASEERYRSLTENAVDGIVISDQEGRIVDWNSGAKDIFGYDRAEILGRAVEVLMPGRHTEAHRRGMERLREGGRGRMLGKTLELEGLRKDGEEFPLELSLSSWTAGGERYFAAIIRDITQRRQLEKEIIRVQDEEQERLGRELHDGVGSLLTAASIVVSGLSEDRKDGERIDPADLDKATDYIKRAGEEVRALSHGLSPVGLERGLAPSLDDLAAQAEVRGDLTCTLSVDDDIPELVEDTARHLYRIAQEAVGNAIKHGHPDRIDVRLTNEDGLVLVVEDDGRGYSNTDGDGTGLGMRTMRHRTSLIGGTLTVEAGAAGGTVVRCRLPKAARRTG
jgi:PAS domain S-box-containing protein